eukprot:13722268-Heterocapsa_arctica.AAC.1
MKAEEERNTAEAALSLRADNLLKHYTDMVQWRASEHRDSAAAKRGDHHEGKHALSVYAGRRRTVDFA